MQFSVKEWRRLYDMVKELSITLRDSQPTYTEFGSYIAPKIELSKAEQASMESQIKTLTQKSGHYMDQCGLRMPQPLWKYDKHDPKTWASEPSFKYGHLLEAVGYIEQEV